MSLMDADQQRSSAQLRGDIAIVGMSCLFPGAPDLDTYWQNILAKVDAISDPPADAWDPEVFYDPRSNANDRVYCKRGGYIGDIAQFRPLEFGVMPVNVDGGEPDQWLALQVAHAALVDAGYQGGSVAEHVRTEVILGKGTYINRGNMTVGYHGLTVEQVLRVLRNLHPEYTKADLQGIKQELKAGLPPFSADTAPALIGNIIVGRIANRLDLMGPSFTVDAACASALLAIEIGVTDLLSRKCDLVLAGGANVNTPLPTLILFCQLGALSRREQIRPFDKDADGTLLSEGLGMVVLKRLEDAERDRNRIYAVIKGVGTASDGRAHHVMAPRLEGEELALRRAYEMAGISPRSVSLIEAHGTATPVGDAVEIQALRRVFGERNGAMPSCALGSVKSMIGHTMPAAGIAALIKTALALYHRVLPPTLNCDEPDPQFELERTPFYVNTETRPWIHGASDAPRRAGINAFGFGGINGHVVLEEYVSDEGQEHGHLLNWETEVCILEGGSRQELIQKGEQFKDYLARADRSALKDLAYTLNSQLDNGRYRLAIIASSVEDLAQKLTYALGRLADPKCRQIKDSRGIYFFAEPLSRQGKLAWMFPGEGAQYPNMLLDLCLHFPEVRNCFDLADRAFINHPRGYLPSDFIFPRSIVSKRERSAMEQRLWQIDGAVEAVLIANRAMWVLLTQLGLHPDVILGHSTGDYAAMFASGVTDFADAILAWNSVHERLTKRLPMLEATLVAVAADSATVQSVVDTVGGDIFVAMENCPHQSVIVGDKAKVEQAIEHFHNRGIIYELLPFDRPYHTPLFHTYAQSACDEFFAQLPISAPTIDVYSCTTVSLYPRMPDAIRELYVAHWVRPVLFQQTIEKMYADGVRIFVEAGPRGNLTAFVDDILRGSPHLAMPSNVVHRSGITQLNHLVGVLAAQGIPLNLDYLYTRRAPRRLPWQNSDNAAKPKPAPLKLTLGMPQLQVTPRRHKALPSELSALVCPPTEPRPAPHHQTQQAVAAHNSEAPSTLLSRRIATNEAQVMQGYLKGMENFLNLQQQVMQAFFDRAGGVAQNNSVTALETAVQDFPLLGSVTFLPNQKLTALRQLDKTEDTFLTEHALGGPISITDPALKPIIVVPLTMSMEILAEAGAALLPGRVLTGMRDIQAHHWIRVDDEPVTLQISAERMADNPNEVAVQVFNLEQEAESKEASATPAIRGIVVFDDRYPEPPPAPPFQLKAERKSRLASVDLYDKGLMFHGPCFQGVVSVERSGEDGMAGQLQVLSPDGLFRSVPRPRFVTDPVLLDAAGQLVGFWAKEYLAQGFVVFPYRLNALDIYGQNRPVGERCHCRLKLELLGAERTRSDFDVLGADGKRWMRLKGWEDRRFDPPPRFHRFWVSPRDTWLSDPWRTPLESFDKKGAFECYRLKPLFEPGNAFWSDLWSSLILNRRERKAFRDLKGPATRRQEWLMGRTVAKEALRAWLSKQYQLELLPADIEIGQDEHGHPIPAGIWTQQLPAVPKLSLTHANGTAVALVGHGDRGQNFGIDLEFIRELTPGFQTFAFSADEQSLLATIPPSAHTEWILRLWCAKESIAKALGRGLLEGPHSIRILALDLMAGTVSAAVQGELAAAVPSFAGAGLAVHTLREEDCVVAVTLCERKS